MTHSPAITVIDEHVVPGRRLGRHVEHDPRSRSYAIDATDVKIVSKTWSRRTAILDQGDLGSCTGNAAAGCLGTDPFYETMAGELLDEPEAVELYEEATNYDSISGTYPPVDTGSTGLAVAKACKAAGLISGYNHALSLNGALAALQIAPVITGVSWYEGFDHPNDNGLVQIAGDVRGGHEFEVLEVDVTAQLVRAANSWGPSWGRDGYFWFTFDTWAQLLDEQGDVTLFTPLSQPAPTPTPAPTPDPSGAAVALKAEFKRFSKAVHAWERSVQS